MLAHEVLKETGISKKALNYYEEKGLIQVEKNENGYREYHEEQLHILWKIKVLRQLDFSIQEIEQILHGQNREEIFQEHFNDVDKKIAQCTTQKEYIRILYEQKEESIEVLSQIDHDLQNEYQLADSVKVDMKEKKSTLHMGHVIELIVGLSFLYSGQQVWIRWIGIVFFAHAMTMFIQNLHNEYGILALWLMQWRVKHPKK